tara:strand:+ start:374 stop:1102 length:729 start_codon:yes stop_codon:yes gene_type:complete
MNQINRYVGKGENARILAEYLKENKGIDHSSSQAIMSPCIIIGDHGHTHDRTYNNIKKLSSQGLSFDYIHIDFHSDLAAGGGCPDSSNFVSWLLIDGLVDKVYMIGNDSFPLPTNNPLELKIAEYEGRNPIHNVVRSYVSAATPDFIPFLKNETFYVSIDLDVIDDSIFSGEEYTGSQEGQLSVNDVLQVLSMIKQSGAKVIGADLCGFEVEDRKDAEESLANIAIIYDTLESLLEGNQSMS